LLINLIGAGEGIPTPVYR